MITTPANDKIIWEKHVLGISDLIQIYGIVD